ncbi:MAG: cytochrome c [Candidatus Hydrogenedentota bacterium]
MMKRWSTILMCAAVVGVTIGSNAEVAKKPTFFKDVAPIFQENCQLCHRTLGANFGGMVAPMALTTYAEVRPWAKAIAKQVSDKKMPPWSATPASHGQFRNERVLSDDEIATIVKWVEQGASRGNPKDAPSPVDFPGENTGWQIGTPDLIVDMGADYFVEDDVEDIYVDFQTTFTSEQLPKDRWLKSVEFKGGSPAVHHVIARPLGGMAPGYDPVNYADGFGAKLKAGTEVNWNMHYHKESGAGTGVWDRTQAGIVFWPKGAEINHIITTESLGSFRFSIPAGAADYGDQVKFTFPEDALLVAFNPHMHLRGKYAKYTAIYPDGKQEVLLDVPEYDFNWQITYTYAEPKMVPKGTVIQFDAGWDNSANNTANPDPTKAVHWGRPTTDEMMFGWMRYTSVAERNIIVGQEGTD